MTLVDFLRARVAKDREDAELATPGPWKLWGMAVASDRRGTGQIDYGEIVADTRDPDSGLRTWNADHIARWDPDRVIAECDAKLAALRHLDVVGLGGHPRLDHCDRCQVLRYMGDVYRGYAEYRSEWAP